jgi:hypothetical protein
MTGDVSLGDNVKAKFGASDDLQIYHDGNHSIIADEGTGNLELHGASQVVLKHPTTGGDYVVCTGNGAVDLYHANALKLATTSTGIDVTGSVTCDGFTSTGIDDNATSTAITIDADESINVTTDLNVGGAVKGNAGTRVISVGTAGSVSGGLQLWSTTTGQSVVQFGDESGTAANHYRGYVSYNHNTDSLNLGAGGSTKATLFSSGNLKVSTGNLLIGTSGKGIDFSAVSDGSRSVSSNLLDDYEEGTWTPTVITGTLSYTTAYYTKIGRVVTLTIQALVLSDFTTASTIAIGGAPFSGFGSSVGTVMMARKDTTVNVTPYLPPSQTNITFYENNTGGFTGFLHSQLNAANNDIYFTITYTT